MRGRTAAHAGSGWGGRWVPDRKQSLPGKSAFGWLIEPIHPHVPSSGLTAREIRAVKGVVKCLSHGL